MALTLFAKIFSAMTALLVFALLVLVLSPLSVSHPVSGAEIVELSVGLALVLAVAALLLRRALAPLRDLRIAMEGRDEVSAPGRAPVHRDDEVGRVAAAYNALLDRLAAQETRAAGIALTAQESERRRVSRELHDQIGQTLTVALLRLGRIVDAVPEPQREDVVAAQEVVRAALQEVRGVAAQLRPGVLEDLGLEPALTALATQTAREGRIEVRRDIREVPGTTDEQALVVYRIAQEALTNVLRHASARTVWVTLRPLGGRLLLEVGDDGVGLTGPPGTGRTGMMERAAIVGGWLTVEPAKGSGTLVRFTVPVHQPQEATS
ncbi:two-component system sensor histidine kinase UhpB [Kineosphaera limosa]|uniref:histidine kinase n=1 Tax=Kineosphaera limosa NBRC 100340 TaxID=1184609 RepID=K6X7V7_9MICO|nr:sensor histidine kinase [Kineosphaera limosa]NYE00931.1 two-component system sensor histidine kinase UhpB [Kineosphaera limosa]GAB94874.1 putative two-component histidine kinase [Kineosphaera limosa NBRC 100340]